MLLIVGGIIILLVLVTVGIARWTDDQPPVASVANFDDCAAAGYQVMESYPARCSTPDGRTFTQDIGNELEKTDLIRITAPRPGQIITSPVVIEGEARGNWFFEASFPARLLDGNGVELAVIPVQATGEWMTTEFVDFQSTMIFPLPTTATGTLILEKDNPSGLPENADQLIIPIRFVK